MRPPSRHVALLLLLGLLLLCPPPASHADDGMCTAPPKGEEPSCGSGDPSPAPHLSDDGAETDDYDPLGGETVLDLGAVGDSGMGLKMGIREIKRPSPADFVGQPLPEPFVLDITATVDPYLPVWESKTGVGNYARYLQKDMERGDPSYVSYLAMTAHTGTHIDMPSHFLVDEYKAGNTVETVDLSLLMGVVRVIEVPAGRNLTGKVLEELLIPETAERIIFKTDSTTRGLMYQTAFESNYTALTPSGARWLVKNRPNIKTVGIDYLSIATFETCTETHVILFEKKIMVIEGLVLEDVVPGYYTLTCLPLKVAGAEGAPVRCILTNAPAEYYYAQMAYDQEEREFQEMVLAQDEAELAAMLTPDEYEDV